MSTFRYEGPDTENETEDNFSPSHSRSKTLEQGTLFEFFRKKSRRDLDRSYSSTRKSRRKAENNNSPNVKLLKELNTSASPNKANKTLPTSTTPFRMPSPFNATDPKLYTSKDEYSSFKEFKETKEMETVTSPLFIKLIKSSTLGKDKPNVPTVPKTQKKQFSASLTRQSVQITESEVQETENNERLLTHSENRTLEDLARCLDRNTKSPTHTRSMRPNSSTRARPNNVRFEEEPYSQPRQVEDSPKFENKYSPLRERKQSPEAKEREVSFSPLKEVKLFKKDRSIKKIDGVKHPLEPLTSEYEDKCAELSELTQQQITQIKKIDKVLRKNSDFDVNEIRAMVNEVGQITVTISEYLKDGLLNVKEWFELVTKEDQKHKQELEDLKKDLNQSAYALNTEKDDYQHKLEELLGYIDTFKVKEKEERVLALDRSAAKEEAKIRQRELAANKENEEMDRMRETIRQLTSVNKKLESEIKILTQENINYKEENFLLKEGRSLLKKEVEHLGKSLEEALAEKTEVIENVKRGSRRSSAASIKERSSRSRQGSPSKSKKSETWAPPTPGVEELTKEVEYLRYKMGILAKENEDLVKRLTDKIIIERENKTLNNKNQELSDYVRTKSKENDHLWRAVKDAKEKLVHSNGFAIFNAVCKQHGLEEKSKSKLTHW